MESGRAEAPVSILFVLPNFQAGGAERVLMTLLRMLDRDRFAPELAVFDAQGSFEDMMPADVPVADLRSQRLRSGLQALIGLVRRQKPELVFATHSYVSVALLAARPLLPKGTKIVVREPNTPSKSLPEMSHGWLLDLGYRLLLRRADLVVCLNSYAEQEILTRYRVSPLRLIRLPNPVAVTSLRQSAQKPVREPGPGLRLIAAGRFNHSKGFDRLLEAMIPLPEDSHLTLYGAGPEEASLKAQATRLDLGSKVRFAGFERHLASALAGADAVIAPSRWEGMPNIVLEALACGTPVISTPEAGGVIDLIEELPADALKTVSTVEELSEAMATIQIDGHRLARSSLLPARFEEQRVAEAYAKVLAAI